MIKTTMSKMIEISKLLVDIVDLNYKNSAKFV